MDRCSGCLDITEILLKTALNTIQPTNQIILNVEAFESNTTFDWLKHTIRPIRERQLWFHATVQQLTRSRGIRPILEITQSLIVVKRVEVLFDDDKRKPLSASEQDNEDSEKIENKTVNCRTLIPSSTTCKVFRVRRNAFMFRGISPNRFSQYINELYPNRILRVNFSEIQFSFVIAEIEMVRLSYC